MKRVLKQLLHDESGTSAVEYGLILAMIVLAMIGALQGLANENDNIWLRFSNQTKAAIQGVTGA